MTGVQTCALPICFPVTITIFLTQERGLLRPIVDVETFVTSSDYLNQAKAIRPAILSELKRLFATDQYREAVLTGGIGIGKNYMADLIMAYMIYRLSCYRNPQVEFGLVPGSNIVFIAQSANATLAKKVVFSNIAGKIRESPYFREHFPPSKGIKTELVFPNNITVTPIS